MLSNEGTGKNISSSDVFYSDASEQTRGIGYTPFRSAEAFFRILLRILKVL